MTDHRTPELICRHYQKMPLVMMLVDELGRKLKELEKLKNEMNKAEQEGSCLE